MATRTAGKFGSRLAKLVQAGGGAIEDGIFVTKPGCIITARTEMTQEGAELAAQMNIDTSRPNYEQFAEFNSRMTYLAFPKAPVDGEKYNYMMARELGHLSVFSPITVTFLLSGISVETSMELIAHGEAKVARLTSSKTKAMDKPLFRVQGTPEEQEIQKQYIGNFLDWREEQLQSSESLAEWAKADNEVFNINSLGSKATALQYTMNIKDFHKLFIGRISPHGNEKEVMEIAQLMSNALQQEYPLVIRSPEEYLAMNNAEKYSTK